MRFRAVLTAVLLLLLFFNHNAAAQTHTPKYNVSMAGSTGGYYEYLPQGYDPTGTTKHPLIIFIHGIYEKGNGSSTELGRILGFGLPKKIKYGTFPTSFTVNGKTEKFIVISPQFKYTPGAEDISSIITYVLAKYKVNPNKVYLTGLSMGGGVTWSFGANPLYNTKIAAMVPICGSSSVSSAGAAAIGAAGIRVWATHNKYDDVVPSSKTISWINYILSATPSATAKKSIFLKSGHDAWSTTYSATFKEDNKNIYEWMLQFERGVTNPPTGNQVPVSNAGADKAITLPTSTVTLAGTGTDADGSISKYAWTKVSGPTGSVIAAASAPSTSITGLVAGTYTFRLTVTDNAGATASDDVIVTVNSLQNKAPIVNAGEDKTIVLSGTPTLASTSVTLAGAASDPDGTVTTYAWTKTSGPTQLNIATPTSATTVVNNLAVGTYVFLLTATDNAGAVGTDEVTVVVSAPPVTNFTSKVVKVNLFGGTNPYTNAEWNNWNVTSSLASGALKYNDATTSAINATLSSSAGIKDNGVAYGSGVAPAEVLRYASSATTSRTLTVSGLSAARTYSLELFASRSDYSGNFTNFTVNGVLQSVSTYNNLTGKAVFNNLAPSAAGTIVVTIENAQTYNYINGFVLTEVKSVKANIFGGTNPYTNAEWNNWNVTSSLASGALKYNDAATSAINATLSSSAGIKDNGVAYGSGVAPAEVLRYASSATTSRTLTVSGLSAA
ncbi:MAG TPA: hypothetical protein VM843_03355, partial [Flavisolibacter sp.]|nr:hypothetical protein [Flavisolibacter sp.]